MLPSWVQFCNSCNGSLQPVHQYVPHQYHSCSPSYHWRGDIQVQACYHCRLSMYLHRIDSNRCRVLRFELWVVALAAVNKDMMMKVLIFIFCSTLSVLKLLFICSCFILDEFEFCVSYKKLTLQCIAFACRTHVVIRNLVNWTWVVTSACKLGSILLPPPPPVLLFTF
jgi:hypothetical protein